MRYSLSWVLTAVLVVALSFALYVSMQRSQQESAEYQVRVDERERIEGPLELAIIDQLAPGDLLDSDPYYPLLVDRIVTRDHPDHVSYSKFIRENVDAAPATLDNCEFHEFNFFRDYASECQYVVIVRDGRCVLVVLACVTLHPA